jgi:hypothetical protein
METTGLNLTPFFEQWYFGEGYPTYSIRYRQVGTDLLMKISHTASKPSVTPTFTNPIDVRIFRQGQVDTTIRFSITSNEDYFTIPNIGTVSGNMGIDVKNWIINKVGSIAVDNNLELNEFEAKNELQISPNPSNGQFSIANLSENASVEIYTMNGQKIFSKNIIPTETIDLRSFGSGTYLVEISIANGQQKRLKLVSF